MNTLSLGDLAQSFSLQRRSISLRNDITRLTDELSSGKVSDIRKVLAGNHSYLTGLERSLKLLDGYKVSTVEAGHLTESMQTSLARAQDIGGSLALDLIAAGMGPVAATAGDPSENATIQLRGIIGAINDNIAGRSLFSGVATDQPALRSADQVMSDLMSVVSLQVTVEDKFAAAQAWFDDPAGFEASIYTGSATALSALQLSDTEEVTLDIRATDPAIKSLIMNSAMAAIANESSLGLGVAERTEVYRRSGLALQSGQDTLTKLRARVGVAQERIEAIEIRNESEKTSLQFALGSLLQADPFEVATELESVQFQLQSLYAATVRSSQLSLVNFL